MQNGPNWGLSIWLLRHATLIYPSNNNLSLKISPQINQYKQIANLIISNQHLAWKSLSLTEGQKERYACTNLLKLNNATNCKINFFLIIFSIVQIFTEFENNRMTVCLQRIWILMLCWTFYVCNIALSWKQFA